MAGKDLKTLGFSIISFKESPLAFRDESVSPGQNKNPKKHRQFVINERACSFDI